MNEEKKEKIWEEITRGIRECKGEPLPDERTILELSQLWKTNDDQTRKLARFLVDRGILLKRKVGSSKKTCYKPNPSIENFDQKVREAFSSIGDSKFPTE